MSTKPFMSSEHSASAALFPLCCPSLFTVPSVSLPCVFAEHSESYEYVH